MIAIRRLKFAPFVSALALVIGIPLGAVAQTAPPPTVPDDLDINVVVPDFALTALPTTLRMPAGKFAFRMTHRFSRPIAGTCPDQGPKPDGCGGIGGFVENFFGFDSSSKVGLELRYGILPGTQVVLHRSNDRAIQMLGQRQIFRQSVSRPLTLDAIVAIEGQNNFREDHSLTTAAVLSHQIADRGSVYVHPVIVFNSNPISDITTDDNHTVMLGFGGRLRLGQSKMYLVAEAAPRLAGFKPGVDHMAFGFESRAGGHVFQLNVSNSFGSTLRQVALGGPLKGDWFLGFNLSRRFF